MQCDIAGTGGTKGVASVLAMGPHQAHRLVVVFVGPTAFYLYVYNTYREKGEKDYL